MPLTITADAGSPLVRRANPLRLYGLLGEERLRGMTPSSSAVNTVGDAVLRQTTYGVVVSDMQIIPIMAGRASQDEWQWGVDDPSVATIEANADGALLSHVSDGTVRVTLTVGGRSVSRSFTIGTSGGDTVSLLLGFDPDSLGAAALAAVQGALPASYDPEAKMAFSIQNHGAGQYVRNAKFWLAAVDLTGVSPWNSVSGRYRAGTLVTARHILFAAHYQLSPGSVVRFVASDGSVVERTMVARAVHPGYSSSYQFDLAIGVLDGDVPASISPLKVMPSDWGDRLTSYEIPGFAFDQEENAFVVGVRPSGTAVLLRSPTAPVNLGAWFERAIIGDSGNPICLLLDGEPILVSVFTTSSSGCDIASQLGEVNQLIADADAQAGNGGTGYSLITADLSAFDTYP